MCANLIKSPEYVYKFNKHAQTWFLLKYNRLENQFRNSWKYLTFLMRVKKWIPHSRNIAYCKEYLGSSDQNVVSSNPKYNTNIIANITGMKLCFVYHAIQENKTIHHWFSTNNALSNLQKCILIQHLHAGAGNKTRMPFHRSIKIKRWISERVWTMI